MPPGSEVGPPLFATDANHLTRGEGGGPRDVLTYSLDVVRGTDGTATTETANDAAKFNINQKTGQITTNVMLNYEKAQSASEADACSVKVATPTSPTCTVMVVVKATDPSGATGMATVTIHVLDVAEMPEVRGPAALTYFENQLAETSPEYPKPRLGFCCSETLPGQNLRRVSPDCPRLMRTDAISTKPCSRR